MVDIPNIFAQGMGAYDDQTKRLRAAETLRASKQAGSAIASGDYTGGANVFNQAGMVEEGHNVLADQQVLQDRQTKAQNDATDRAQKSQKIKLEGLSKITDMVASQPAGTRAAYLQQHIPLLRDLLGADPSMFANMTEDQLSDQSLAGFKAYLGKAKEDYTIGGVRYGGSDNKPKAGFAEFDPHKTIYAVGDGPDAGPPAAPAPAPAATPTVDPAIAPAATVRGIRNNNPVNLTTLPHGQWAGQSGADGRFAVFDTPEAGLAAADKNLVSYATNHGINTISGIINRWSPAGDGANDPKAYATTVAKELGVDPNQPINLADPKVRGAILHSMSKVELGGSGAQLASAAPSTMQGGAGADTIPPPAAPPHIAGFHAISQAKPEWQDMGDGRQRNQITGKVEGTKDEDGAPLSDSAVKLQAGMMIKTGQMPSLGMGKAARADRVRILNEVDNIAKSIGLTADDIVAGTASLKAATKGLNNATTLRAAVEGSEQTVLANGQAALKLADQVGGPTRAPVINRWIQAGRKNLAGDAQVAAFHLAVNTVATEYAKVMTTATGTGGQATSDSARAEANRLINTAQTPEQLRAVIAQMKIEMDNRAQSLRDVETGLRSQVRNTNTGSPPPPPSASPPPPPAAAPSGWGPAKVVRH